MRGFYFIAICLCFSCEKPSEVDVQGIWQMKNLDNIDANYYELNITDSIYSAFSEKGMSYIADYELKDEGIMFQYVRDLGYSEIEYIDTLQLHYEVSDDSLIMYNLNNPKNRSSWYRIKNVKAITFTGFSDFESFTKKFKKRYADAILESKPDSVKNKYLNNFDRDWNLSLKY